MPLGDWHLQQNLRDAHNAAPPFSSYVQAVDVSSGAVKEIAVPSGATHVVIAGTSLFAFKAGATGVTATWPAADVSDGSGIEIGGAGDVIFRRLRESDTHLSIAGSPDAFYPDFYYAFVTAAFWRRVG